VEESKVVSNLSFEENLEDEWIWDLNCNEVFLLKEVYVLISNLKQ